MSLCNVRSFTILLVLELAVVEYQVEAFAIQRTTELIGRDLEPAESDPQLQVGNDLKHPVKSTETENDSPPLTVPIQTTAKTEEIQKNDVPTANVTGEKPAASDTSTSSAPDITTSLTPVMTTMLSPDGDSTVTTVLSVNTVNSTENNVSSTSTTVSPERESIGKDQATTMLDEILLKDTTITDAASDEYLVDSAGTPENSTTTNITSAPKNTSITNSTNELNSTQQTNTTSQIISQNTSSVIMNNTLKNVTTLSPKGTTLNKTDWKTEENNSTSYSTDTVKGNITTAMSISTITNEDETTTPNQISSTTIDKESFSSEKTTGVENKTKDENNKTTESLTGDYSRVTAVPYWKKYTTIERKRVNVSIEPVSSTEKEEDLLQSGTAQTQTIMSLEKALNIISEIPSLQQLKDELFAPDKVTTSTESTKTAQSTQKDGINDTVSEKSGILSDSTTISSQGTTQELSVVSSKRAGFLDFSSRPTVGTEKNTSQEIVNITEVPDKNSNRPKTRTTPQTPKGQNSMTSQSQLVEDAINEELMKEEILNDSVENANTKKLREDRFGAKVTKSDSQVPESSTEDRLRVKPISNEKKNNARYTVSPNYKPLKKIEVQPPKPFVRNPDDNSWRNESLSSLGIVFKANNSSKPFTQVLKNKTETQWNNLLERYSKGDEPELRERLEKIAEMRKSKKKKINQYGETVYTDYEEAVSGENSNSTNPKDFVDSSNAVNGSSFMDDMEIGKITTTRVYMFDDLMTTTMANKKVVDEYEEDDESDYTLPNIDLKKYISPTAPTPPDSVQHLPASTPPPGPFTERTYPPDRRPTVQYFPPREKPQKVIVNDYDTDFQKKINEYTYDIPKTTNPATAPPANDVTFSFQKDKFEQQPGPNDITRRPEISNIKNAYLTQAPFNQQTTNVYAQTQDGAGYDRASHVIKHLRDFIDEVVKSDERLVIEEPLQGITANGMANQMKLKPPSDYYDYETTFRKDVINRFVENFNQNSERFKADFPVLYNTTVVHPGPGGGGAESTAFMKRLYEDIRTFQNPREFPKHCDPLCERTVELSPAYELHYYVPEEEEKQVVELKPVMVNRNRPKL